MAFTTPPAGPQYWAHQRDNFQYPADFNHQLNPSVPGFQPNGMEVQRYLPARPPTPPYNSPASPVEMVQLQRYVMDNHFSYTKDMATLERMSKTNANQIAGMKETVRNDMQTLQSQIKDLEQRVTVHQTENGVNHRSLADQDVTPSPEFMANFSKERIAEVYLEEADDYEKAASKLRDQAQDLCAGVGNRKLVTMKLLDAPSGTAGQTKVEFACCGVTFASIQEMLKHAGDAHGLRPEFDEALALIPEEDGEKTPRHVPPRRSKIEKPVDDHTQALKANETAEVAGAKQNAITVDQGTDAKSTKEDGQKSKDRSDLPPSAITASNGKWKPFAVRNMPSTTTVASNNAETFTWEHVKLTLGGEQWSPGFYYKSKDSILKSKAYWMLEAEFEPYIPSTPGEHGAKLTAFFNDTLVEPGEAPEVDNYLDTPVFICPEGKNEYVYFGNYSQRRFSDKLDYDRIMAVPEKVRGYWAEQLAAEGRPEWVTKCLMEHFWPKPTYSGPMPTDSREATQATEGTERSDYSLMLEKRVTKALYDYAIELKDWEKDARLKVNHITADTLMTAFGKSDADEEPGLRMFWEYMQFERYDEGFYNFLVKVKQNPRLQTAGPVVSTTALRPDVGGKTVKPTGSIETVRPSAGFKPSTGSKPHTGGIKPWEQDNSKEPSKVEAKTGPAQVPNGDLSLAKHMHQQFTKAQPSKPKANRNGKVETYTPPHARGKK